MHNVIVIHVGAFVELTRGQPLEDIWIASGLDKDLRCYSINAICTILRDSNFQYFINLLLITGCGTTSAFIGKGKGHHGKLVKYR